MPKKVIVIGIGGASCSGKTLLAKHLRNTLPSATIILHQDDFAPPVDQVPYSSQYPELQDWDDPPTCILWPEFRKTLRHIRETGKLPEVHMSHDHLNKQVEVGINPDVYNHWRKRFKDIEDELRNKGEEAVWFIVDGFVLFWDKEITEMLDVQIMLRVPHDTLKSRREERQVYVLQNPDDAAAGGVWVDPPNYFSKIVYPAYVKAHEHLFADGDVEKGELKIKEVGLVEPREGSEGMTEAFEYTCKRLETAIADGKGSMIA